jgi:hypothetical protein
MSKRILIKVLAIVVSLSVVTSWGAREGFAQSNVPAADPALGLPPALGLLSAEYKISALVAMSPAERDPILRHALVGLTLEQAVAVHDALVGCYYLIDHQSTLGDPPNSCLRLARLWELLPKS